MLERIKRKIENNKIEIISGLLFLIVCFNSYQFSLGSSPCENLANPIQFVKENVVISLSHEKAKVEGIYFFYNSSEEAQNINMLYPLHKDNDHPYPHSIEVWEVNSDSLTKLPWAKGTNDICWQARFLPKEAKKIKVEYEQRLKTKDFIYILTSTKKWRKPIKEARFVVKVPTYFENVQFSFPANRIEKKDNLISYFIDNKDFVPQKELIIEWLKGGEINEKQGADYRGGFSSNFILRPCSPE